MKRACQEIPNPIKKVIITADDVLEKYADGPIPKEVYLRLYPQEYRIDLIVLAMTKCKYNPFTWSMANGIINAKFMNDDDKFKTFIELIPEEDLAYLGW